MKVEIIFAGSPQHTGNASYPPEGHRSLTSGLDKKYPVEGIEEIILGQSHNRVLWAYTLMNLESNAQRSRDTRSGRHLSTVGLLEEGLDFGRDFPWENFYLWIGQYKVHKLIGQGLLSEGEGKYGLLFGSFQEKQAQFKALKSRLEADFEQNFGPHLVKLERRSVPFKTLFYRTQPTQVSPSAGVQRQSSSDALVLREVKSLKNQLGEVQSTLASSGKELTLGPREMLWVGLFAVLWFTQLVTCARGVSFSSQPEESHQRSPIEEIIKEELKGEKG
jgi:hypothetical protein